jgi:hypothetical protein
VSHNRRTTRLFSVIQLYLRINFRIKTHLLLLQNNMESVLQEIMAE